MTLKAAAKDWALIFNKHPDSWRLAFDEPGNILGYWEMHSLKPKPFKAAKSGKLIDGQLRLDMLDFLAFGIHNVYFSMIAVGREAKEKYGNKVYMELFRSIFDVLEYLSINHVFIREITAAAWTPDGEILCEFFGMRKTRYNHVRVGNVSIYSGSIFGALKRCPAKFQELRDRYQKERNENSMW